MEKKVVSKKVLVSEAIYETKDVETFVVKGLGARYARDVIFTKEEDALLAEKCIGKVRLFTIDIGDTPFEQLVVAPSIVKMLIEANANANLIQQVTDYNFSSQSALEQHNNLELSFVSEYDTADYLDITVEDMKLAIQMAEANVTSCGE